MTKPGVQDATSEKGHGGSAQKRFSGDCNSGAAEYNRVWKRWARAAIVVKKVGGMPFGGSGTLHPHSSGRSGCTGTGVGRNQGHVPKMAGRNSSFES